MRNKTKRLLTIRKLIESELISSQEELLFRLKEMNVEATQSTLSRDLKFMKVAKIPHKEKGYIYVIPESIQNEQRESKVWLMILIVKILMKFWELLQETILFLSLCAKESAEAN